MRTARGSGRPATMRSTASSCIEGCGRHPLASHIADSQSTPREKYHGRPPTCQRVALTTIRPAKLAACVADIRTATPGPRLSVSSVDGGQDNPMNSPTSDPADRPVHVAPTAHAIPRPAKRGVWRSLLGVIFVIGNFVCWPIFFVIGMALALWQTRHAWFPFGRRVGRKHFWTAIGLYLSLGGLFLATIYGLAQDGDLSPLASNALYGILGVATASSGVTVAVGRLRDRDMSGWWVLVYYGLPAA